MKCYQYGITFPDEYTGAVTRIVSRYMNLPFDRQRLERKRGSVAVYAARSKEDPNHFLIVEFPCEFHSITVRCGESVYQDVESLMIRLDKRIREKEQEPLNHKVKNEYGTEKDKVQRLMVSNNWSLEDIFKSNGL
ncbi:hypothetical protein [Marininema halotolerans]|uniref:Uncharacterized protein n=1 Tax=Marininema halotolerans TaxID=1155944 RepID=A0A1I6TI49_9BACL|nr:hypothetical protein [Marininema halotolerans]SFS88879.1 hypothetical protein SAMN05444972_11033 [Marininema halotolerans]